MGQRVEAHIQSDVQEPLLEISRALHEFALDREDSDATAMLVRKARVQLAELQELVDMIAANNDDSPRIERAPQDEINLHDLLVEIACEVSRTPELIRISCADDFIVNSDRDKLTQVLMILVSAATRNSMDNSVQVSVGNRGLYVTIQVAWPRRPLASHVFNVSMAQDIAKTLAGDVEQLKTQPMMAEFQFPQQRANDPLRKRIAA